MGIEQVRGGSEVADLEQNSASTRCARPPRELEPYFSSTVRTYAWYRQSSIAAKRDSSEGANSPQNLTSCSTPAQPLLASSIFPSNTLSQIPHLAHFPARTITLSPILSAGSSDVASSQRTSRTIVFQRA